MSEPVTGSVKQRPVTIIYFAEESGNAMKRLATRVRDQGVECNLIWSHLFHGPDDINANARAVILEDGAPNVANIESCHRQFSHDVEIHYVNSEGKIIQKEANEEADTGLGGAVDPAAAVQALADEDTKVEPEPTDPEPVDEEDDGGDSEAEIDPEGTGDVSDEADKPETE